MHHVKPTLNPFYFFVLLALSICFSCSDDENLNPREEIQNIEDHFPVADYKTYTSIVYKNALGREISFSISLVEGNTDTIVEFQDSLCIFEEVDSEIDFANLSVHGEYAVFSLVDENDPAYSVCFRITSATDSVIENEDFDILNRLSAFVGERSLTGPTEEDNPVIFSFPLDFLFNTIFTFEDKSAAQDMILLGQDFVDVFETEWPSNIGITKMYVNEDFGMVAYLDENRDLFVWDRFE